MIHEISTYDINKTFVRSIVARDIAEPLPSFDATTPASDVRRVMLEQRYLVAGVRCDGLVTGYVVPEELAEGTCGEAMHDFATATVLADSAFLLDVVRALDPVSWVFVTTMGTVAGVITRRDLQDPPVRMWLFGLITVLEMRFLTLIRQHFHRDNGWSQYLSPSRLEKARQLQAERQRRNLDAHLVDCLQFADKGQIVVRNETLRNQAGFASRRRGDEVIKRLERLRNNLAHAQDIVSTDWDVIVAIVNNLERLIDMDESG